MIIKNISIRHKYDFESSIFEFDDNKNLFYSTNNSAGKTTFLRSILYALGFNIPNTKKIDFSKYDFEVTIEYSNRKERKIKRSNNTIYIDEMVYTYPSDWYEVISNIFVLDNSELASNVLGAIYIDQEKGWTLLNRGKIIGDNGFSIESFIRGLNNNNVFELRKHHKDISDEIKKYQLLRDVTKYKNEIKQKSEPLNVSDAQEELNVQINIIDNDIENINKQISDLQSIRRNNAKFASYIDSMGLQVCIEGKIYSITKQNLYGFDDFSSVATMQINELVYKKNEMLKKRKTLYSQIKKETLVDTKTALEQFNMSIDSFKINEIQIQKIIDDLTKTRDSLKEQIKEQTLENNPFITKINLEIKKYWDELEIDLPYNDNYLFTHDLKSLSGALLYKMIIAYKFSYIKVLQDKLNYNVPIFIDSPAGREIKKETIDAVINILNRDFANNQVFVCSIFDFDSMKLESKNVLSFDNIKPFDRKGLFENQ